MRKQFYFFIALVVVIASCSTEKEGFLNKSYHYVTTKYNGYFNANVLVDEALISYRNSYQEDYTELLPIENFPNEEEAVKLFASLDTAKKKLETVIAKHSMPNQLNIKTDKSEEHNAFIDEAWLLVGKIKFYKHENDSAKQVFDFLHQFFKNNKSAYEADIWKAKILINDGDYAEAKMLMDKLDKVIENDESNEKEKKTKSKRKKHSKYSKKKKKKKEKKPDKFPKKIKDDLEMTRASMFIKREDYGKAIEHLEKALEYTTKKEQKARLSFILGQLYAKNGNADKAVENFTTALKKSPDYELEFYARINRAMVANGAGSDKLVKELNKMLKDEKNGEFKDQIYFALANIELNNGNRDQAVYFLHRSVAVSVKNDRQKGKSYLQLADMHFKEKDYLNSQKYYDSCANAIPESFPNADGIKTKAEKLQDLVVHLEEINLQDSLQRIASLSDKDQEKFLKNLSKKLEKEEEQRKENEARRLEELKELQASFAGTSSGSGGKWYFYNDKLKNNGRTEFQQLWGNRKLEDNWRRKNKVSVVDFDENDSITEYEVVSDSINPFDPEVLAMNIPKTQGAIDTSNIKLFKSLYESGVIYKEQLGERKLAINQFETIVNKKIENEHVLPSAYQLYKMYEGSDASKSDYYKQYVLNNHPNSEFANIIRDPDFIKKQLERRQQVRDDYAKVVDRYQNKQFGLVVAKCNVVINNDTTNELLPKYYLLKAYALGKSPYGDDKVNLIASLNDLIDKFPVTTEAEHAKKILERLKSGDVGKENSLYKSGSNEEHYFVAILPEYANSNKAKINLFDFNKAYFGNKKLKLQLTIFKDKENLLIVKKFKNAKEAMQYYNSIDQIGGKAKDLQDYDRFVMSLSNFETFYQDKNVSTYRKFFNQEYK